MLHEPSNVVRLACEIPPRIVRREQDRLHLLVTMDLRGDRIASVLVDGPPVFSSYRRMRAGRGSSRDAAMLAQPELLPRNMQWRGHFQGRAIRLRRDGADMVLEPSAGSDGTYSGFWTWVQVVDNHRMEANGAILCRTVAGTLSESARS
jgi:hypothetical protein